MNLLLGKYVRQSPTRYGLFQSSPHRAVCTWPNVSASPGRRAGTHCLTSSSEPPPPYSERPLRSRNAGHAAPISGEETEKSHTEQGPGCTEGVAHIGCFFGQ
jgi:hypothetical protein